VDNVNQLEQQWFWYRLGSSGLQYSIDTLGSPSVTQYSSNYATVSYAGTNGLNISVGYTLSGGAPGSGAADLGENIAIQNTSSAAQTVHFFQYSNFVLLGSDNPVGDVVQFQNWNDVQQTKGVIGGESLSETVITPKATFRQLGEIPAGVPDAGVPNTLDDLNTVPDYQLNSPNTNTQSSIVGPGDVTWAYEWDKTLAPGGTLLISKDKQLSGVTPVVIQPEPSALALGLVGLLMLFWGAIRRRA
jgi:hypothetical protein